MLPKANRLRRRKDIQTLFSKGESVFDDVCGLKYRRNQRNETRVAVIVGKRISKKAVVRNRIRRRIREIIRHNLDDLVKGYDVALLVQGRAVDMSSDELRSHVLRVLKKADLLE
jgi:ribonuclease P protein component